MLLNTTDDQARAIQKIYNEMEWQTDPAEISKRIHELNNGLIHEDEFIYILSWLKNVSLIHKLDQFQIPENSKQNFRVPDLMVFTEKDGAKSRFLIEVKTSQDDVLKWSEKSTLLGIKLIEVMRMRLKHTRMPKAALKVADLSPSFSPLGSLDALNRT